MPTKVVLGLQHGDEGKGRVVDDLVETWADVIVRFQGGGNAGHTVYNSQGDKFVTHSVPVGVLNESKLNIVSRGCVVNPEEVCNEIIDLDIQPQQLKISKFCPVIEPLHIMKDKAKYQKTIGTTAKGIGPAYSDFYARDSILLGELLEYPLGSIKKIQDKFFDYQAQLTSINPLDGTISENFITFNKWMDNIFLIVEKLRSYMLEDENILHKLYKEEKNILIEGAQGCGLNIYSNNYPNVTSSAPTVGGVLNSTGLNHNQIDEVIGVMKSYKTKVGSGEFRTRCDYKVEEVLAHIGKEFGATTGRPRKCGWLDLDEVKKAIDMNGVDHICVVKTDVLTHVEEPQVYYNKEFYKLNKIDYVNLNDSSFKNLLDVIKEQTGVKQISFTTGPKRGEIVWAA